MALTSLPPGPRGPRALHTLGWITRPGPYASRLRRRYGDTFTLRIANEAPFVMLSHPDDVRQVFTGDPSVLHAGEGNQVLRPLLGRRSVLLLDGAEHMSERKALLPPFHGERMQAYGDLIARIAEAEVASWPAGEIEVRPRMQALTLEVIMRAVFGVRDERVREHIASLLDWTSDPARMLLMVLAGPRRVRHAFQRVRAPLDRLLGEEIARRREAADLEAREDILSMLLAHGEMSDEGLRDELITLLLAGHETTATALAWALERLARHPQAWERLRADGEDYLDAVVKETLRLRPVVPIVLRLLKAPMEIGGWELPAGVAVAPNILLMHSREDVYPQPRAFRPERFLEQPAGTYTWIPFGGGVRRCLGASFAIFEMKTVLRAIAAGIERLEPDRSASERTSRRAVTLVPARGARVIAAPRAATARRAPPVPSHR
jgi:cytochrome P450 family 135